MIIPYIMENKTCLKPPTRYIYIYYIYNMLYHYHTSSSFPRWWLSPRTNHPAFHWSIGTISAARVHLAPTKLGAAQLGNCGKNLLGWMGLNWDEWEFLWTMWTVFSHGNSWEFMGKSEKHKKPSMTWGYNWDISIAEFPVSHGNYYQRVAANPGPLFCDDSRKRFPKS